MCYVTSVDCLEIVEAVWNEQFPKEEEAKYVFSQAHYILVLHTKYISYYYTGHLTMSLNDQNHHELFCQQFSKKVSL